MTKPTLICFNTSGRPWSQMVESKYKYRAEVSLSVSSPTALEIVVHCISIRYGYVFRQNNRCPGLLT